MFHRTLRPIAAWSWYLFALLVVLAAVSVSLARYFLPYAEQYKQDVEIEASSILGTPVKISQLTAEWKGLWPSLVLQDVGIFDQDSQQQIVKFNTAKIGVNLIGSLINAEIRLGQLSLTGMHVQIEKQKNGKLKLSGINLPDSSNDEKVEAQAVADLLFRVRQLKLEDISIDWLDYSRGGELLSYSGVNVTLRNRGDRHQLEGMLQLPENTGRTVEFAADVVGDLFGSEWGGELFLKGSAVDIAYWMSGAEWQGLSLEQGAANFSLWTNWQQGKMMLVEGSVDMQTIQLDTAHKRNLPIETVSTRFSWERKRAGWQLTAENFSYRYRDHYWPATNLSLHVSDFNQQMVPQFVEFKVNYVDLSDLSSLVLDSGLLQQPPPWLRNIEVTPPSGKVQNFYLYYDRRNEQPDYYLSTDFSGLSIPAYEKLPGVGNLDGHVEMDESQGTLALSSNNLIFSQPRLFRNDLSFDLLNGELYWRAVEHGLLIESEAFHVANSDLSAVADLNLSLFQDMSSPLLDLYVQIKDADGAKTSKYLPVGIMKQEIVSWLDGGIVGAQIKQGGVVFQGRLADFPFHKKEGKFEVQFDLLGGDLDYAAGWPKIDALQGTAIFTASGMDIDVEQADLLGGTIFDTTVSIPDFLSSPAKLQVDGYVKGDADSQLEFLRVSPLRDSFGKHFDEMHLSGSSLLELHLGLTLSKEVVAEVSGNITFDGNDFSLPPFSSLLTGIQGQLNFTEKGVWAEQIHSHLLGGAAVLNVESGGSTESPVIKISANGRVTSDEISRQLDYPFVASLSGETDVNVGVAIADGAVITISSDLKGMAIDLPEPLGKSVEDNKPLKVVIQSMGARGQVVSFDYLNSASAELHFLANNDGMVLHRGGLLLGAGLMSVPEQGVSFFSSLKNVSLLDWSQAWDLYGGSGNGSASVGGADWVPINTALSMKQLDLFGNQITELALLLEKGGDEWKVSIDSNEIIGKVNLPYHLYQRPLQVELERLHLSGFTSQGEGEGFDPMLIPPMSFTANDFRYGDRRLGKVVLEVNRHAKGIVINKMRFDSTDTVVEGSGRWLVNNGKQQSFFVAAVESKDTGKTLNDLGYKDTVDEGEAKVTVNVNWLGPLYSPNLSRMSGSLEINVEDGRLLDVSPGAGRMFGLFSFQSLSRRMLLDFSDMFQKGFSFDRISGKFDIRDGSAYTNDLFILGPAALIELRGRTGLVSADYDQTVTVTPYVAENLPILGYLLSTPQTAALLLLAQRLFKSQIDEATQVKYRIQGPWLTPVIEKFE